QVRAVGGQQQADLDESAGVPAERAEEEVDQPAGGAGGQDEQQQRRGDHHRGLAQVADPAPDPAHRRGGEQHGDQRDDDQLHAGGGEVEAGHPAHPLADLGGSESERGGGAEQGGQDDQHVDRLARGAVGVTSEQGPQDRRDQALVPEAVGGV